MCHEEALVEDAKHYFNRDNPSVAKIVTNETVEIKFDDDNQEYMSPVVSFGKKICETLSKIDLIPYLTQWFSAIYIYPMTLPLLICTKSRL